MAEECLRSPHDLVIRRPLGRPADVLCATCGQVYDLTLRATAPLVVGEVISDRRAQEVNALLFRT